MNEKEIYTLKSKLPSKTIKGSATIIVNGVKKVLNGIDLPDEFKGKLVKDIIANNKKDIFYLMKNYGLMFSDDVLELAGIKTKVHSHKITIGDYHENKENDNTIFKKDKLQNIEDILDEITGISSLDETTSNNMIPETKIESQSTESMFDDGRVISIDKVNSDEI